MKKTKRVFSAFLAMVLMMTFMQVGTLTTFAADASHTVDATTAVNRTNALVNALVGKYFTTSQTSCGNNSCDSCYNANIIKKSWLKNATGLVPDSYSLMPEHYYNSSSVVTSNAWSCAGFANYCLWYIYAKNSSDNVRRVLIYSGTFTKSNMDNSGVRTGDVIRIDSHHSVVYISHNSSGVTVLDSNWDSSHHNLVQKHTIGWNWRSGTTMAITRGKNWSGGSSPHTHSYTTTEYEAAHPHKVYKKCSCGATQYTGETRFVSSCSSCMSKDSRYPTPFKAYNLANAKTEAYDSVSGTRVGYIYGSDECTIQEVYTNGWCKVLCPWTGYSNGRTVYAKLSTFLNTSYTPSKVTVATQTTTYTRSNASTNYGYIGAGDTVTKVGSSGSYTQIIYPLTAGGYKCAWAILPTSVPSDNSYPVPFKCRIISTTKVKCYNDVNFSSSPGYIYPEDDCVITAVYSNGKVQCKCPWSDGSTKTVYVNKSVFINSSTTPQKTTAPKYAKTYLRTDMSKNIGWIDKGDAITIVATNGNKTQIIYPADVGQRCAWVYTSDLQQTYTVSYDANGGTGAPSNQTKTHGVNLTLSDKRPTRNGYTFLGWATSPSASTATYTAGGGYSGNADLKLYAVWKANEYNISFDANGGDGAPSPQTKTHGKELTLSSTSPKRTGYTFLGWATTSSAASAAYQPGQKFTVNASTTLYAVWKANTYTISYDAKGGTGAPSPQTKTHDVDLTLSDKQPTLNGYTFLGWSTSSEATHVDYQPGTDFELNASTTLYAVWEKNAVTVTKIEIASQPGKTVYQIGDSLNTAGLSIKVTYSDNSTKTITSGFTVAGFESNTAGVKTVTVSYGNQTTSFKVTVQNKSVSSGGKLKIGSSTVSLGKTVQVPVYVENTNLCMLTVTVNYDDSKLRYVSYSNSAFDMIDVNSSTSGKITFSAISESKDITNGEILILTFEVVAESKCDTQISVSVNDAYNERDEEQVLTVENGTINISEGLMGDVNGDNRVNIIDARWLLQVSSGNRTLTAEQQSLADVNGDGRINIIDARWLLQVSSGNREL